MTFHTEITIPVTVTCSFDPGEPEVRYFSDGTGQPGVDPSVEIEELICNGHDISKIIPDEMWEGLEKECWEALAEEVEP